MMVRIFYIFFFVVARSSLLHPSLIITPPITDTCLIPHISEYGYITNTDGCDTNYDKECCTPYKCAPVNGYSRYGNAKSTDDSVASHQFMAKVDGEKCVAPPTNPSVADSCCILGITDITGLVCSDAAMPDIANDPNNQLPGPEYCLRVGSHPPPSVDNTKIKIYEDNQPGNTFTKFNQDVLDRLACLCCSGFVYATSSANLAGANRRFTTVLYCNGASPYPIDGPNANKNAVFNQVIGACENAGP